MAKESVPMCQSDQGSSRESVQGNQCGNESDGDPLEIDAEFVDGNIATKVVLMNTTKRAQEGAQARPQAFEGVGMNFPDAIADLFGVGD